MHHARQKAPYIYPACSNPMAVAGVVVSNGNSLKMSPALVNGFNRSRLAIRLKLMLGSGGIRQCNVGVGQWLGRCVWIS